MGQTDRMDLIYRHGEQITTLWTTYVIATFAAAAFSQYSTLSSGVLIAIEIGFLAFTLGHWSLVSTEIKSRRRLCEAVFDNEQVAAELKDVASMSYRVSNLHAAGIAHVVIDIAVSVCLLWQVVARAAHWLHWNR